MDRLYQKMAVVEKESVIFKMGCFNLFVVKRSVVVP